MKHTTKIHASITQPGLDARDHVAIAAMQAILTQVGPEHYSPEEVARRAFAFADALIVQSEQPAPTD